MADYKYLPTSNGSGDAAIMHVNGGGRLTGSTTLPVDSTVNVPAFYIATVGTELTDGFIDPATATVFKGHISSSNLIIDGFAPGSTDSGNTAGQIVVIKPNTYWSDLVAQFIVNASGNGTPEALTMGDLTATSVTATSLSFTGAVLLDGFTNATYRYTMTGTDNTNGYALFSFAHGLGYTPDVVGRLGLGSATPTTVYPMPFSYIKNKSYSAIPPSLTIAIQSVDATNINVGVGVHDISGATLLSINSGEMQFQFYCSPFPGLNV